MPQSFKSVQRRVEEERDAHHRARQARGRASAEKYRAWTSSFRRVRAIFRPVRSTQYLVANARHLAIACQCPGGGGGGGSRLTQHSCTIAAVTLRTRVRRAFDHHQTVPRVTRPQLEASAARYGTQAVIGRRVNRVGNSGPESGTPRPSGLSLRPGSLFPNFAFADSRALESPDCAPRSDGVRVS